MERCIKCGGTLPAGAKLCPYCGNPVSYYEEKMQPVQPASRKQTRSRAMLILAIIVLSGLLIASLAYAIVLWTAPSAAPPKLGVSPGSLDYGTLQVGSQSSQVLTLSNGGKQDLNWSADKGKADWLTLDPGSGRIPSGGSQTINVRADTTLLTAGRYSASISFSSNGGAASVNAVLSVTSGPTVVVPVVSGISPTSGPAAGGTTVTIRGSGFTGASQVLFGTATSTFTVNNDTQITAVSPGGSGIVHVTVTTPGGPSTPSNADQFTYPAPAPVTTNPTLASISPSSGPLAGGTTITIRGSNFTGASRVLFGTVPARSFTVNSATQITAVSPAGSGTVHVTVTTPKGTSATSNADRFTYQLTPTLASISPSSGPLAGGTSVIIKGRDFTGASKVLFGSVAASRFTVNSDTQITAVSPNVTRSGTVDVRVTTPGGTSNAARFTYMLSPTVTKIDPNGGNINVKTPVTITGTRFTGATNVKFGNLDASNVKVVNDTTITAVSPAVTTSGPVDVRVTTPGGTSNAVQYSYWVVQPKITSISPSSGPVARETTVTIKGEGLTGASQVQFGTVKSTFKVDSDTTITAVSPAVTTSGPVDVTVTTPVGTSNAAQYTYLPPPTVTGIVPNNGSVWGGDPVTITGTGFTGATNVKFGNLDASNVKVVDDITITAVSPPSNVGTVTVQVNVSTPGGTSTSGVSFSYKYPVPQITSITPNSGKAGDSVTIEGAGFKGATRVDFGGQIITFAANASATVIKVSVPDGTGTVNVTVTGPGGNISNAVQFTYS